MLKKIFSQLSVYEKMQSHHKSGNLSLFPTMHHSVFLSGAQQSFHGSPVILFTHLKIAIEIHMHLCKECGHLFQVTE